MNYSFYYFQNLFLNHQLKFHLIESQEKHNLNYYNNQNLKIIQELILFSKYFSNTRKQSSIEVKNLFGFSFFKF